MNKISKKVLGVFALALVGTVAFVAGFRVPVEVATPWESIGGCGAGGSGGDGGSGESIEVKAAAQASSTSGTVKAWGGSGGSSVNTGVFVPASTPTLGVTRFGAWQGAPASGSYAFLPLLPKAQLGLRCDITIDITFSNSSKVMGNLTGTFSYYQPGGGIGWNREFKVNGGVAPAAANLPITSRIGTTRNLLPKNFLRSGYVFIIQQP